MSYERNWILSWSNSVILALAIVAIAAVETAKAQQAPDLPDLNVINGLFTPTQSERFFREGRENFEREIEIFNHPERYLNDELLQFDSELIEQMERSQLSSNFSWNNGRELSIDRTNYLPRP